MVKVAIICHSSLKSSFPVETHRSRQHFDRKHSFPLACGVRAERNSDEKMNETSVAKITLLESQDVLHIFDVT